MYVEGDAYRLPFEELYHFTESDMSGLPSLDVSLYYLQSVKFRTNPLFYLFDEHEFTKSVHEFYKSPLLYARAKPIWFIQYLVIMALGKALVSRSQPAASQNVTSAGSHLLTRALRLLPDITHLAEEPIDATEILCAIALYLQSIDHRCAAHIYIGQALRMAQSYGLHKVMQPGVGSEQLIERCRRLWWTVYMLDRRFSSSYGVPAALHDEDITVPVPTAGEGADEGAIARKLYVKICQLQGRVISTVYSSRGELNKTFVTRTRAVLKGIAGLSAELKKFSDSCFGEVSRIAAHVNLAYHQCILVTSRPVLFYALKQRLEGSALSQSRPLSSTMKGLIQVCIDSATQIVSILAQLKQHDLLDVFFPFDLESAASAGFVLEMASKVHPKLSFTREWFGALIEVLDFIALHGNVLATQRKAEIEDLVNMLNDEEVQQRDATSTTAALTMTSPAQAQTFDPPSFPSLGDPFFDNWHLHEALSGGQIMELVTALDVGNMGNFDMGNTDMQWS
ncbi:hypothetical protein, variant [Exophiala mesophila]|nr:hypothetical protein, variant [Exophiala mesophila]KIV89326.1 hypothetical protein, variant [Exophiala mesophila]